MSSKNTPVNIFWNDLFKDEKAGTYGVAGVYDGNKEYARTVRLDNTGRPFFTWNGDKIFMDQFVAYTPEEIVAKINSKDEHVFSDDLCRTLMKYGMDSLLVTCSVKKLDQFEIGGMLLSFETYSNIEDKSEYKDVVYKFVPEYLHAPSDGYKLKIVPANVEEYSRYPKRSYYVGDLVSLLSSDNTDMSLAVNPDYDSSKPVGHKVMFDKYVGQRA
jgi:hypothetical protein